jgi:hypothetical protein
MAFMHTTGDTHHRSHDREQIAARILMTLWGVPLVIGGAFIVLSSTSEGADTSTAVALGAAFLIAAIPAFVAWRSEEVGGRLLVAAGVLLAVTMAIIQYVGIQHGVMRNGEGQVNPWWTYGLADVLFGLPAFIAGLLLLDHLRRQRER